MSNNFFESLYENPVIAAVNDLNKLESAIKSPCKIIFVLSANIFNLKEIVEKIKYVDKEVYLNIDLLEGFSRDALALEYIYKNIRPDGIITAKGSLISTAKNMSLFTIQRVSIIDSPSLESGIKSIRLCRPDLIEVLPGIMPKILKRIYAETNIPIIAGGLVEDEEDIANCLNAGADGISTNKEKIWYR